MIKLQKHYPLTVPGTAALLTVLYVFGKGYADSDYQSIFIASVFFLIFLILFFTASYYSARFRLNSISVKTKGEVSSSLKDVNKRSIIFENPPPLFFRYSAAVKGRLHAADKSFYYQKKFNSDRNGIINFSFRFNTPGLLDAVSAYFLEDIFGLFRISCADEEKTSVRIVPGLPENAFKNSRESMSSFVKNKKPDENDYEKVLMREYMRGDRSRDINWKASSKSNTIYTRIAPGNDNEIKKINFVYSSDSGIFNQNIYKGFLIYRYFREYFRYLINDLYNIENYKFNVYINGRKIQAENRNNLDNVYRELSEPELMNDFEKSLQDAEGAFIVFCENRENIENLRPLFSHAAGVRFFSPQIVKANLENKKIQSVSGYLIDGRNFEGPGEGVFPGRQFFKSMRNFYRSGSGEISIPADPDSRYVEIVTDNNGD